MLALFQEKNVPAFQRGSQTNPGTRIGDNRNKGNGS